MGNLIRRIDPKAHRSAIYVSVALAIYFAHSILVHGKTYFSGQIFNEAAWTYFAEAKAFGMYSLLMPDAGYLPGSLRVISLGLELLGLSATSMAAAYAIVSLVGPVILVTPFILARFRRVVESDASRFLIVSAIFLTLDWESRQFINWTVLAGFTIFYLFVGGLDQYRRPWIIQLCAIALLASKPLNLPLALVVLFFSFRSKSRVTRAGGIIVAAWTVFLGAYILNSDSTGEQLSASIDLAEVFWTTVLFTLKFIGAGLVAPLQNVVPTEFQIVLGAALGIAAFWFYKSKKKVTFFLSALLMAMGNIGVLALGIPVPWSLENLGWVRFWFFRHLEPFWIAWFLIYIPIFWHLVERLNRAKLRSRLVVFISVFLCFLAIFVNPTLSAINPILNGGNNLDLGIKTWRQEIKLDANGVPADGLCFAVNPFATPFGKGCNAEVVRGEELEVLLSKPSNTSVLVAVVDEPGELRSVVLASDLPAPGFVRIAVKIRNGPSAETTVRDIHLDEGETYTEVELSSGFDQVEVRLFLEAGLASTSFIQGVAILYSVP